MPESKPKKRIGTSSCSSHGAYFMPTITRSSGPSDLMKARTVSDHVTSLRSSTGQSYLI